MKRRSARKCKHCRRLFLPDYRNHKRQKYCSDPVCRHTYRIEIQRLWRAQPENRDHFKGPHCVQRTQAWRKAHPGYWYKKGVALQDDCKGQDAVAVVVTTAELPLQDDCFQKNPLIIGMISHFSGALQDDIESFMVRLHAKGQMILGKGPGITTNKEAVHAGEANIAR